MLIVEDCEDIAEVMQVSLEAQGCEAIAVDSRDKALAFIRGNGLPNTIIMDLHMPGLGADEFIDKLATINPRLPRMILTTAAVDADSAAKRLNIAEVLRKPFELKSLLAQVDCCRT